MNVDYWLLDNERDFKFTDIPSPTDMAQVIERVHKVLALWVYDIASTTEQDYYIQILEALDGEQ